MINRMGSKTNFRMRGALRVAWLWMSRVLSDGSAQTCTPGSGNRRGKDLDPYIEGFWLYSL